MIDKTYWVRAELFPDYWYAFCPSEKAWQKTWKDISIDGTIPPYPTSNGRCSFFDGTNTKGTGRGAIVTLRDFEGKDPVVVAGLLIHEAVHIKQSLLRVVGEDNVGDETEAYLLQRISQDLMWAFHERILK